MKVIKKTMFINPTERLLQYFKQGVHCELHVECLLLIFSSRLGSLIPVTDILL